MEKNIYPKNYNNDKNTPQKFYKVAFKELKFQIGEQVVIEKFTKDGIESFFRDLSENYNEINCSGDMYKIIGNYSSKFELDLEKTNHKKFLALTKKLMIEILCTNKNIYNEEESDFMVRSETTSNDNIDMPNMPAKKNVDKKKNDDDMNMPIMPMAKNIDVKQDTVDIVNNETNKFVDVYNLVDDIFLKNYLNTLNKMQVIPLNDSDIKNNVENIRLLKVTEMVYNANESSIHKFSSIFNSVATTNSSMITIITSDGKKTEFYLGIRSLQPEKSTTTSFSTLTNAISGQFPGTVIEELNDVKISNIINNIKEESISSVSCVANNKAKEFINNENYLQGLEKFALSMQNNKYTAVILANPVDSNHINEVRRNYENIYTQLAPLSQAVVNSGNNTSISSTHTIGQGTNKSISLGMSHSSSNSLATSATDTTTSGSTSSTKETDKSKRASIVGNVVGTTIAAASTIAGGVLTGGVGTFIGAGVGGALGNMIGSSISALNKETITTNSPTSSRSTGQTESTSRTEQNSYTMSEGTSYNTSDAFGTIEGTNDSMQMTLINKPLVSMLERIDKQLIRLGEFESIGAWENASYFFSDDPSVPEVAAATYKALISGENSGIETSAINTWNNKNNPLIAKYVKNFIHPQFEYRNNNNTISVTPASLVSGNELAIHMGLPRKSVCGFPIIEHAEFARELIYNDNKLKDKNLDLGCIYHMGRKNQSQKVALDINALCSHTFITGSTGSGKSNTIYTLLDKLTKEEKKFLVIEPTKGEYKNVFGTRDNVRVYGTNPKLTPMLRINPFKFHEDIHILEHLDRLVDIFNVCWPMYAAMPAILKEAMERAYESAGWDLKKSENSTNSKLFPTFSDVLDQISVVLNESQYSADNKGDYIGALSTRIRSLTNGINGMIFTQNDLTDEELFNENVIVDLSRVGSMETKALIMGLLVIKLSEYYMVSDNENEELRHVTVLEEAHNLLKRTSTEQSSESSNLLGKSVEMLSNAIAEMRTYGEGFIIADQSPNMLDMSAIRNTNTKIIMKLPDESDRELVGKSANLNDDQIVELSRLKTGVAAVYQNNWLEPVLCEVDHYEYEKKKYVNENNTSIDVELAENRLLVFIACEGNIENSEELIRIILNSDIKSSVKRNTIAFVASEDKSERQKLFTSLVYEFFNSKEIFERFVEAKDITHWANLVVPKLQPSVVDMSSQIINMLLSHLVEKHEQETGNVEFSLKFMELYKEKGGIYNV